MISGRGLHAHRRPVDQGARRPEGLSSLRGLPESHRRRDAGGSGSESRTTGAQIAITQCPVLCTLTRQQTPKFGEWKKFRNLGTQALQSAQKTVMINGKPHTENDVGGVKVYREI